MTPTIFDVLPLLAVGGSFAIPVVALLIRAESRLKRIETIVERELTRNGGTSLRDRVVRIEYQLQSLNHNLAEG